MHPQEGTYRTARAGSFAESLAAVQFHTTDDPVIHGQEITPVRIMSSPMNEFVCEIIS